MCTGTPVHYEQTVSENFTKHDITQGPASLIPHGNGSQAPLQGPKRPSCVDCFNCPLTPRPGRWALPVKLGCWQASHDSVTLVDLRTSTEGQATDARHVIDTRLEHPLISSRPPSYSMSTRMLPKQK